MTAPDLSIRDLKVRAGDRLLLSLTALDLPGGSILGIRGPSGAGKSTLLMALAGLAEADGAVRWGNTDLLALSPDRRAAFRSRQVGMVFQDFLLFDELSAPDNAAMSALWSSPAERTAIRERAGTLLDRLGIDAGMRRVSSFSGGERQRVAVARALAANAPIILADEPTASLDRATANRLTDDLVAQVRQTGRTLVVVSHDPLVHEHCDGVLTVEDGQVRQ